MGDAEEFAEGVRPDGIHSLGLRPAILFIAQATSWATDYRRQRIAQQLPAEPEDHLRPGLGREVDGRFAACLLACQNRHQGISAAATRDHFTVGRGRAHDCVVAGSGRLQAWRAFELERTRLTWN